ncbi:hypothetical protein BH11MYX1_BH11MYX1_27420 [soil metagenome]
MLGLVACASTMKVEVRGDVVRARVDVLRRDGFTALPAVIVGDGGERQAPDLETVYFDQNVAIDGRSTTIAALVAECDRGPCRLDAGTRIVLRELARAIERHEPRPDTVGYNPIVPVIAGAVALAGIGGTALCIGLCEQDKTAKSLSLAAITTIAIGVYLWAKLAHWAGRI